MKERKGENNGFEAGCLAIFSQGHRRPQGPQPLPRDYHRSGKAGSYCMTQQSVAQESTKF